MSTDSGSYPGGSNTERQTERAGSGEHETSPALGRHNLALPGGTDPYHCDSAGHCITCSDEAVPMRILEVVDGSGIALCEGEGGQRMEVLIGLLDDVARGDLVLVHAGAALARVAAEGGLGEESIEDISPDVPLSDQPSGPEEHVSMAAGPRGREVAG